MKHECKQCGQTIAPHEEEAKPGSLCTACRKEEARDAVPETLQDVQDQAREAAELPPEYQGAAGRESMENVARESALLTPEAARARTLKTAAQDPTAPSPWMPTQATEKPQSPLDTLRIANCCGTCKHGNCFDDYAFCKLIPDRLLSVLQWPERYICDLYQPKEASREPPDEQG